MSSQITEAFVQQYKANIFHLSQQKGSRLRSMVRSESQKSKRDFYERLGLTAATKKTSRHSDTQYIDSKHSRRAVTLEDYVWADLIDQEDKIRLLIDPASSYSQSAMFAMGRAMDQAIIDAARGNAYSGEDGLTSVALPVSQKLLAAEDAAPATPTNLNLDTLHRVKALFDEADVDEMIPRYFGITSSQLQSLLKETPIRSSDYNTVKALVQGQIDTFMGFKFVRSQLFPKEDGYFAAGTGAILPGNTDQTLADARRCIAWAGDGLLLSVGADMTAKMDPLPTKNYATQVFASMSIGATRLEEEKVVEVYCNEA